MQQQYLARVLGVCLGPNEVLAVLAKAPRANLHQGLRHKVRLQCMRQRTSSAQNMRRVQSIDEGFGVTY
jgi:hypothetical protein